MKKILRIIFALNLALLWSFTAFAEEETTTEEHTEHDHNVVIDNAVPASCLQAGLTEGSHCEECGEILTKQEIVPKLEHKKVKIAGKKETCTQTGLTDGVKCDVCETILVKQNTIPKSEHKKVKIAGKKATCTKSGLTDGVKCEICETVLVKQKKIEKLGHKIVKTKAVAATCTKTGLTAGKKCKNCGKIIVKQKKTAKIAHKYQETVLKCATKSQNGKVKYACKMCGKTKPYSTHSVSSPCKVTLDETWYKVLTTRYQSDYESSIIHSYGVNPSDYVVIDEKKEIFCGSDDFFAIADEEKIKYTAVKKLTFYGDIIIENDEWDEKPLEKSLYEVFKSAKCEYGSIDITKKMTEQQKMTVYEVFKNAKCNEGYLYGSGIDVKKGTRYLKCIYDLRDKWGSTYMSINEQDLYMTIWYEGNRLFWEDWIDFGDGIYFESKEITKGKYKGLTRTDIYYIYDEKGNLSNISDIVKKKEPQWKDKLIQGYKEVIRKSTSKYYYTGKEIKPKVKVYDKDGLLISSKYYTVKYSNNIKIGKGTVNVIMKGKYKGKLKKTFDIVLKSPTKVKVNLKNGGVNVLWKKVTGAKKYEVYRSVGGDKYKKITTTTKNSFQDKTYVKKDTFYKYYIVAIDKNGNKSDISKEVGVTDYTERYSYVEINDICYRIDRKKNKARTFGWGEVVTKYFGINGQVMDTTVREYFKKYFKDATGWWDTEEFNYAKMMAIKERVDKTHQISFEEYIEGYPVYAITTIGTTVCYLDGRNFDERDLFNKLEYVKLPKNLEIIDSFAFMDANLKNVKLPETIKELGSEALGMSEKSTVYFPKTIKNFEFVINGFGKIIIPGDVKYTHKDITRLRGGIFNG